MVVGGASRDRNSRGRLGPAAAAAAGGGGGGVRATGQAQRDREGPGGEHRERTSRGRLAQREGSLGPEQLPPPGPGRRAVGPGGQFPGGNSRGMVMQARPGTARRAWLHRGREGWGGLQPGGPWCSSGCGGEGLSQGS